MEDQYDVFVSHSSQDKIEYVDDLVEEIKKLGIRVFYDTESIDWGDNLKEKINDGLKKCKLAVVVISNNYFGREWTEFEIKSLLERQNREKQKIILPILHGVSKEDFLKHYPSLNDIVFKYSKKCNKKDMTIAINKELMKKIGER